MGPGIHSKEAPKLECYPSCLPIDISSTLQHVGYVEAHPCSEFLGRPVEHFELKVRGKSATDAAEVMAMKEGSERAELKVHCMLRRRRGLTSQPHSIDAVSHIAAPCNPTQRLEPTSYGTVAVSLLALAKTSCWIGGMAHAACSSARLLPAFSNSSDHPGAAICLVELPSGLDCPVSEGTGENFWLYNTIRYCQSRLS